MRSLLNPMFVLALSVGLCGPMTVLAQTPAPAAPNAAANQTQQSGAGKFIQDLGNQAVSMMADKSLSTDQKSQKYRDILQNSFDMPTIGHFVLGRTWNTSTPEQQQEFMQLFQQSVLKTYGDRLSFYSGESFRVTGERSENDKDSIVNSEVTHPNGAPPTKVDWRVRQNDDKYAIIDVVIEGVSQSVTQRDEYASIIQRNNGKIDGLLTLMRQRAQDQGSTPSSQGK